MKGRNKGIMIMPATTDHLIRVKHFLMSRDKEWNEIHINDAQGKAQPVLMCEFNWADRILYKLSFSDKKEKVNVYC